VDPGQRIAQLVLDAVEAPAPIAALRSIGALRRELEAFERAQVARALAEGETFASIARELGISRQAVHRRFRHIAPADARLVTAPDVRRVLLYASEEARGTGSPSPAGEHIVLGVLRASDAPAAAVLHEAGATLEQARAHIQEIRPSRFQIRSLLEAAARRARERGGRRIEVEHLLLGALEDDTGGAARMLRTLRVDVRAVRDSLTVSLGARR